MRTGLFRQIISVVTLAFFLCWNLSMSAPALFADHKESHNPQGNANGNGNGNGNGNANAGGNGNGSVQSAAAAVNHAERIALARDTAERAQSRQAGGRDFHSRKPGDHGERKTPAVAASRQEESLGAGEAEARRLDPKPGRDRAALRAENRKIVEDFERAIHKLRGQENARWSFHPKDDRGQGNMGKVDMLDPYGHSKDDRMELYGNRGRVTREMEEILTFLYTNYLFVDWTSFYTAVGNMIYGLDLETLGFTPEEITFLRNALLGVYGPELAYAVEQGGFIAMEPVEMSLLSISDLDLSRLINYAAAMSDDGTFTTQITDSSFEYSLSLTNPYNEPLTLTVSTTIQYTPGGVRGDSLSGYVYVTNPYYFENYTVTSYTLDGESTQTWENVTLQPGETIVLTDAYSTTGTSYTSCGFNYGTQCHDGNGYTFGVTITDSNTGTAYYEPSAGWFNGDESIFGYGYDGYTVTYRR